MPRPDRLIYLALGGAGEIGMNMYLYGYGPEGKERFILVDMGVSFPTMESTPGVELIMADPSFIQARADRLEAIFITHGHEDHVGALGLLWHRLKAPVHARRFTAAVEARPMVQPPASAASSTKTSGRRTGQPPDVEWAQSRAVLKALYCTSEGPRVLIRTMPGNRCFSVYTRRPLPRSPGRRPDR